MTLKAPKNPGPTYKVGKTIQIYQAEAVFKTKQQPMTFMGKKARDKVGPTALVWWLKDGRVKVLLDKGK